MNLFQIFLCDPDKLQVNLTQCAGVLAANKQSILDVYRGGEYQLYTNPEAQDFLAKFDPDVLACFNTLVPYAFRADLLRYCLLYEFGGWYFDQSIGPVLKVEPTTDHLAFVSKKGRYIENMMLYARPKTEYFHRLIFKVVEIVKSRRYGVNSLAVTGPIVMRDEYRRYLEDSRPNSIDGKFTFGEYVRPDDSVGHLMLNGKLVAKYKKDGSQFGRIDFMGFVGTNDYNKLYKARAVFK